MPLRCTGLGPGNDDHCCYVNGERCQFLRENVAGRRFACGLRLDLGSWAAVNESSDYAPIGEHWKTVGQPFNYCELFDPSRCCRKET